MLHNINAMYYCQASTTTLVLLSFISSSPWTFIFILEHGMQPDNVDLVVLGYHVKPPYHQQLFFVFHISYLRSSNISQYLSQLIVTMCDKLITNLLEIFQIRPLINFPLSSKFTNLSFDNPLAGVGLVNV